MAHEELPPLNITPGAIRFNTDSMKLEYFRIGMEGGSTSSYAGIGTLAAGEWVQLTTDSPDIETGGTRGLTIGGYEQSPSTADIDEIYYYNLATTGNATDFGTLSVASSGIHANGGASDRTRAISAGGYKSPAESKNIEFVTMSSTGNSTDFGGDLTDETLAMGCLSSSTRGIFCGGRISVSPSVNTNKIDYIVTQSTGNNAQDFGDLSVARRYINAAMCSSTRGIVAGGTESGEVTKMEFVTMSTLGNMAFFGDLTDARGGGSGSSVGSNSVRGLCCGGYGSPAFVNVVDSVEIATLGNATDFGDLSASKGDAAIMSSPTRLVYAGGQVAGSTYKTEVEYFQFSSSGNAIDFGDQSNDIAYAAGASNGHGGLG